MTIWIAHRVVAGREFAAASELGRLGTEAIIVPRRASAILQRRKGGPKAIMRPLAPGYVFASYHGYEAFAAAYVSCKLVKGWIGVVGINQRPSLLTPMDVRALYAMETAAAEPHVEEGLKPGDRLRIRRGRYAELDAIVARLDGGRVIATVTMFGRPHGVAIPIDQVEAA